jgi:hypothetical protein
MTAWRTVRSLSAADGVLLIEAAALLLVVRLSLSRVGFHSLRATLQGKPLSRVLPRDRVVWAVKAVARRFPATSCLVEALVMNTLLRRHGHVSDLKIGVRLGDRAWRDIPLDAHAWVECDGRIVIGAVADLDEYAVLA